MSRAVLTAALLGRGAAGLLDGLVTPQQATLVQDAAGLVAAHLRGDAQAQDVLLEAYATEETFSRLVEAFVYYVTAAVQVAAQMHGSSWQSVLARLPDYRVGLIPGVVPNWAAAQALVVNLIDASAAPAPAPALEVASCVEGAYGLAVSVTTVLGGGEHAEALEWTTRLSSIAAREN